MTTLEASYILPIRTEAGADIRELTDYLRWLEQHVEVIVIDGSPPAEFLRHAAAWSGLTHLAPEPDLKCLNGKVWGVLTGLDRAMHEKVIIADDDVRYSLSTLAAVVERLDEADVIRPQNYFEPTPWHALWDGARSLVNRVTGGDWPGTLAVRKSALARTNGYDGDCLFENLELVRTVKASGGKVARADDVFVRRIPPTSARFWSQRVRQAYDEFARPGRMAFQLSWLPVILLLGRWKIGGLFKIAGLAMLLAEAGRQKDGARRHVPPATSLMAPVWVAERAVCAWLAVATRLMNGGVRYSTGTVKTAATPEHELERRFNGATVR